MTKNLPEEAGREFPAGALIDDRYKVVQLIGHGRLGLLHEVEHVRTGRRLALKTLRNRDDQALMEEEARATSLLKNSHAVRITDMGTEANVGPYLVMDLIKGRSLRVLLDDQKRLPVAAAVNIALQVCECLAEAHDRGLVHCDLKPQSILLASGLLPDSYDVKVIGFGAAKSAPNGSPREVTRPAGAADECCYASPEQLQGAPDVDMRTDVYAVGVVLYECLAGQKPYEATTSDTLIRMISAGPPAQLGRMRPDAPANRCQAVMRALSVHREQRQPSLRDFAATLLPHGDASLAAWLRAEEHKPAAANGQATALPQTSLLGSAPEQTARPQIEAGATVADDDWAPRPNQPAQDDASMVVDPLSLDSDPITTSWAVEPPHGNTYSRDRPLGDPWRGGTPSSGSVPAPQVSMTELPTLAWVPDPRALSGGQRSAETAFEPTVRAPTQTPQGLGGGSSGTDRDTPTEMYRKSDWESGPVGADGPTLVDDRDTPPPDSRHFPFEPPRFSNIPMQLNSGEGRISLPASSSRQPTVQSAVAQGIDYVGQSTLRLEDQAAVLRAEPPVDKPGWQRSLDRMLVRVGDGIERRIDQIGKMSVAGRVVLAVLTMALVTLFVSGSVYALFRIR